MVIIGAGKEEIGSWCLMGTEFVQQVKKLWSLFAQQCAYT